jgi:hypothetical protein
MVSFVSASAARGCGLSSTQIFGARQFIAGIINHIMARKPGSDKRTHLGEFHLHHNRNEDQKRLQDIGGDHDAIGN